MRSRGIAARAALVVVLAAWTAGQVGCASGPSAWSLPSFSQIFTPAAPGTTGDDAGPVKLLFVGRIGDARKGARYLFEAYAGLVRRKARVTLEVVGEVGGAAAPPELPGLTYHGPVSFQRLTELYRSCDVFVAPSTGGESSYHFLMGETGRTTSALKPTGKARFGELLLDVTADGFFIDPNSLVEVVEVQGSKITVKRL